MLKQEHLDKLKENWGEKADSLSCYAQVRIYDPSSYWQCYLYSLNPQDEDEVMCIIKVGRDQPACVERWYLTNIKRLYNYHGEPMQIDQEYRPKIAADILTKLNQGIYDR